ncbi:hypothetical protein ACIBCM_26965 [Streptomyces sp. NPDC051018]|uniref:hypothetical protein n=1 Tax=Streptomyces sp. NPDC051018 TaxID=3365639 RepID=UPI0037BA4A73
MTWALPSGTADSFDLGPPSRFITLVRGAAGSVRDVGTAHPTNRDEELRCRTSWYAYLVSPSR